jgi:hypothetical protein
MGQRNTRRVSFYLCIGDILHRYWPSLRAQGTAVKESDVWIVRVQLWLVRHLLRLRVRLVRVFPVLDCLCYPRRVPLRILDLLLRLDVRRAPYIDQVEEGSSRVEGGCSLPGQLLARASRGYKIAWSYWVTLFALTTRSARSSVS